MFSKQHGHSKVDQLILDVFGALILGCDWRSFNPHVLEIFLLLRNRNDIIVMQAAEEALRQKELQKESVKPLVTTVHERNPAPVDR